MITAQEAKKTQMMVNNHPLFAEIHTVETNILSVCNEGKSYIHWIDLSKQCRQILIGAGYNVTIETQTNDHTEYLISWGHAEITL